MSDCESKSCDGTGMLAYIILIFLLFNSCDIETNTEKILKECEVIPIVRGIDE